MASLCTRLPSWKTTLPGTPTTVLFGGTDFTTAAPAATFEFAPTTMAPMIAAPGTDDDVVFQRRMALAALQASAAEGHSLIQRAVAPDLSRLADDHAHAVIDEQPGRDLGTRVDLDAGGKAHQVGEHSRDDRDVPAIERMDEAMRDHRVQSGIREQHLEPIGAPPGRARRRRANPP